jgi:hypothetical protein
MSKFQINCFIYQIIDFMVAGRDKAGAAGELRYFAVAAISRGEDGSFVRERSAGAKPVRRGGCRVRLGGFTGSAKTS